jgi:DNA-binding GntR family transcriptional regulator
LTTRIIERVRLRQAEDVEAPFAGRDVFTFARLGSVEGEPVLLEHFFLDPQVFPGLDTLPVARERLSRLVDERYHRVPTGGRQMFRVAPAPAEWQKALDVDAHRSLLVVERWLDFAAGPSALFVRMLCRTDRVQFGQTLGPDGAPWTGESR